MFSTFLRQVTTKALHFAPTTTTSSRFFTTTPYPLQTSATRAFIQPAHSSLYKPIAATTTVTAATAAATTTRQHLEDLIPVKMNPPKNEDELLNELLGASGEEYEADPQQRAILAQLMDKYGLESDECKEFTLTTSDLSPADEIRMLSPCGIEFTNSIYYAILAHRFGLGDDVEKQARGFGLAYERCLVERSKAELEFWHKARESTQMHSGWVQASHDNVMRKEEEDRRIKMAKQMEGTSKEAEELEKVAKNRVEV